MKQQFFTNQNGIFVRIRPLTDAPAFANITYLICHEEKGARTSTIKTETKPLAFCNLFVVNFIEITAKKYTQIANTIREHCFNEISILS